MINNDIVSDSDTMVNLLTGTYEYYVFINLMYSSDAGCKDVGEYVFLISAKSVVFVAIFLRLPLKVSCDK